MNILILLGAFLIYLVMLTIVSTLLDISIRIATKEKLGLGKLFLPSTLIIVLWCTVLLSLYLIITKICGTDMIEQIMNYFMKIPVVPVNFSTIFGLCGVAIFITVILQAFIIYIINFAVSKPIKNLYKKLTKNKEYKPTSNTDMLEVEENTIYIDLLSCIFASIVIFLIIIGFIFAMSLLAKNVVGEVLPKILK